MIGAEARRHAITASELLEQLDVYRDRLKNMTDDERLQLAAAGAVSQLNADMQFTIDLAAAHAATAIALQTTEEPQDVIG